MYSIDSRFVTGPSNILSAGMYVCVHFSAPKFKEGVAVKGLCLVYKPDSLVCMH